MLFYLVCFDISDDRSRYRVVKALKRYGIRVQYSVFELSLSSSTKLDTLLEKLNPLIDEDDSIRCYRLCATCREQAIDLHARPIANLPGAILV